MDTLSGTTHLRPVRLGFVAAELTTEAIRDAARLASGVWGGMYFPFLVASDPRLLQTAEALALDVLHPLDEAPTTTAATDTPGFRWRGRARWGPFGTPGDADFLEGLLPIDRLVGSGLSADWHVNWCDDELAPLYDVWFGGPAATAEQPLASPSPDTLWSTGDPFAGSPIARTTALLDYSGEAPGLIVVVVGDDPADLARLWNLRAVGGHVHPWIVGRDKESLRTVTAWLGDDEVVTHAGHVRRGEGTELGRLVEVSAGSHQELAMAVQASIEALGFTVTIGERGVRGGWTGHHPLATSLERDFALPVSKDVRRVEIALPALPVLSKQRHWPGIVAADVVVHREAEPASGRTLSLPAIRRLSTVIDKFTEDMEQFHRASGGGRVVGVQATASSVTIGLIPGIRVFETVLPEGATVGQSDDGRFSTQFVDRLGGVNSAAASQPAIRQMLYDLSNADRSAPLSRLLETARRSRGAWQDLLSRQSARDYAKSVVLGLANTGLIVPTVSVRCPKCATETDVRPDDLATDMRCAVCLDELNLGLALALKGPANPWRYRLAAHLPPRRVRSGLATMAANAVIRTAHRAGSPPAMPHVFGLTVEIQGWKCEVDIAALIMDGPLSLAVIGELKGGRELIDKTDVENLQHLQQLLRDAGIETFLMAGTTRDHLDPSEISILRTACEAAPQRLVGHHSGIVLPIVLCGPDISTPWFDDSHPWRWGTPGGPPLSGLANVSCERNLGLQPGEPSWDHTQQHWSFGWDSDVR